VIKDCLPFYLAFIAQAVILMAIVIFLDKGLINSFKGQDNALKTVDRTQLPEG